MHLQEISKDVWKTNYRAPREKTHKDTWDRQARASASVEKKSKQEKAYEDFLWLLNDFKGIAGGRITANLGVESRNGTTLMNCFVHAPGDVNYQDPDSLNGIYDLLKAQALTLKSEGGYGMNFSWLRPAGMYVSGIGARTPGVLKFMELWDTSSDVITKGSEKILGGRKDNEKIKIRKGAQMGILEIWHPEVMEFIEAKLTKGRLEKFNLSVGITNGFMEAVENDHMWYFKYPDTDHEKYKTEWFGNLGDWESKGYPVQTYGKIKARELWDVVMQSTYTRNDPGVIFIDLINKLNPLAYAEYVVTTNPCLTGDTLVAVADGKEDKTIKELADKGLDVPVYCLDGRGNLAIRTMRHPRWTGNEKVYKITMEGGHVLRQTGNHKYRTTKGDYKRVDELEPGDGLRTMSKFETSIKDMFPNTSSNSQDYIWLNNGRRKNIAEHRMIYEFNSNSKITKGMVIHHKDHNAKNNYFSNLEVMTKSDHDELHAQNMLGDMNPMIRWYQNASPEEKQRYHDNMSKATSGKKNGRYSGHSNDELKRHAIILTESIGRTFTREEWMSYAKKHKLPMNFSKWRNEHLNGINGLARWAAEELDLLPNKNASTKILKTYKEALDQGYDAQIKDNQVIVHKKCEFCGNDFTIGYVRREQGVCSAICGQMQMHERRQQSIREMQLDVFNRLKYDLDRVPQKKEWVSVCKENDISPEISRKSSPFRSWNSLKESALEFNHRIISIEEDGCEDVYNGTVDEFHNFFVGGFKETTKANKPKSLYFNNLNCGEVPMSTGVCNLFSLNLAKFIIQDENGNWIFDYETFKKAITIAVRFSDNINDISTVPLEEYKKSMTEKRRIGVGTLGLGSLHYILGIKFGSEESLKLIDSIYLTKAETEILASANLGKEKGSFKLFDKSKYFSTHWWKNLPISKKVKKEVEEIGEMRNSHRSANAPTGNMSVYVGVVSGGVEPVFDREYTRWSIVSDHEVGKLKEKGFKFPDASKGEFEETKHMKFTKKGSDKILQGEFEEVLYQFDKSRGLIRGSQVTDYGWMFAKEKFSEEKFKALDEAGTFVTTADLPVQAHIDTLRVIAKYTDMSSSKTINIPEDYSYEDFKGVYKEAWKSGIKGITTYRAGTMTAVLEKREESKEKRELLEQSFIDAGDEIIFDKVKLPDEYNSKGYIIRDNNGKKWYVNLAFADRGCTRPFAIFVSTNCKESSEIADDAVHALVKLAREKGIKKKNIDMHWEKCQGQSNIIKISRVIGFLLHHNVPVVSVVDALVKMDFPFSSFSFHITRLLKQFIKDGTKVGGKNSQCPQCKGDMIFNAGCILCKDCNWSKC